MADDLLDLGGISLYFPDKLVDWKEAPMADFDLARKINEFKGSSQQIDYYSDEAPRKQNFSVTLLSQVEIYSILDFFLVNMRGRHKKFWFPLAFQAFQLAAFISLGSTKITVFENKLDWRGYERLILVLRNGDKISRKITDFTRFEETGTIEFEVTAIGREIQIADVVLITFLLLCRLDQDSMRLQYFTTDVATAELAMVELPNEYPS